MLSNHHTALKKMVGVLTLRVRVVVTMRAAVVLLTLNGCTSSAGSEHAQHAHSCAVMMVDREGQRSTQIVSAVTQSCRAACRSTDGCEQWRQCQGRWPIDRCLGGAHGDDVAWIPLQGLYKCMNFVLGLLRLTLYAYRTRGYRVFKRWSGC